MRICGECAKGRREEGERKERGRSDEDEDGDGVGEEMGMSERRKVGKKERRPR